MNKLRSLVLGRDSRSAVLGQGLRFALAGSLVTLVYLVGTLTLSGVVGLPFQAALASAFCLALCLHFTLQRFFVWAPQKEFALPLHHQVGRYLLLSGTQYGLTAAAVALLPALLGLPTVVVYLGVLGLITSANFLLFRHRVFHASPDQAELNSSNASAHLDFLGNCD